eukprot:5858625-Prymnesium_polylepis.2
MSPFTLVTASISEDGGNFHCIWRSDKYHFTYPSHVGFQILMYVVAQTTSIPLKAYSYCEEISEDGYEHTHLAV